MKKILLFTLLVSSLFAEAKLYIGAGGGIYNETYEDTTTSINNSAAIGSFKIGYGERKAYAIELSFDYIQNNSKLIDTNDGQKYGINIDFVKAFDFDIYVLPFVKAGFGAGEMKSDLNNGSLNYGSFNLGTGVFLPLSETFDIELAYNYRYVSYEKINDTISTIPKTDVNIGYIGINARF